MRDALSFPAQAKLAGEFAATVLLCQLSYMLPEGTWQDSNLRPSKEPSPSPPAKFSALPRLAQRGHRFFLLLPM